MPCPRRVVALLLALCFWLLPVALGVPSSFRVLEYDTRVEIERNSDIVVTENITISIPTSGTNQGIIRDIPVSTRWREPGRQHVRLRVEAVSIDGVDCPVDDCEMSYPLFSIYLRDRSRYLEAGEHRFRLRFRMSEQVGFFEAQDELTWNAVGDGWEGGVEKARALILPPKGVKFTQQRAWLGALGSHDESYVSIRRRKVDGRQALVFEATRPIGEGEAFTCAVGWKKGVVTNDSALAPAGQWGYTLLDALLLLAALAAAYALWARYGRDPQVGAVIPLFYPPRLPEHLRTGEKGEEYMSPAAVNYVSRGGKLEARGLAALFLSLAHRGDCRLHGNSRSDFVVEKLACTTPCSEERAVLEAMPDQLPLRALKTTDSPIGQVFEACEESLGWDYHPQVAWKLWPQLLLLVVLALLLGLIARAQMGAGFFNAAMGLLMTFVGGCLLALGGLVGVIFLLRQIIRTGNGGALKLIILGGAAVVYGVAMVRDTDVWWMFGPLQWALILATLAVPLVFLFLMDAPTREQLERQRDIKGLALYIGTAESERFNFANPPDEDLQLYHRLLPYAVALGLEDAWGKRFAVQIRRALAEGAMEATYSLTFTHDFVSGTLLSWERYREAVAFEASSSSGDDGGSFFGGGSSFSGFGGGAGSGGGGGGGRAC